MDQHTLTWHLTVLLYISRSSLQQRWRLIIQCFISIALFIIIKCSEHNSTYLNFINIVLQNIYCTSVSHKYDKSRKDTYRRNIMRCYDYLAIIFMYKSTITKQYVHRRGLACTIRYDTSLYSFRTKLTKHHEKTFHHFSWKSLNNRVKNVC